MMPGIPTNPYFIRCEFHALDMTSLDTLLRQISACTVCQSELPHLVRLVVKAKSESRIVIVGQAPGRGVHQTGIPWNDPSGDRLREWLGVGRDYFYRTEVFALVPMGFCFPGTGKSGDLPPRPKCAPLWHGSLMKQMKGHRLILLVGSYARDYYLPEEQKQPLYRRFGQKERKGREYFVLPLPSPRNNLWLRRYPFFEREVLPQLRDRLLEILQD